MSNQPTLIPLPSGHAMPPGTGPDGETCQSCDHRIGIQFSKVAHKCNLARAKLTQGRRSDIRLKDPACEKWQPVVNTEYEPTSAQIAHLEKKLRETARKVIAARAVAS